MPSNAAIARALSKVFVAGELDVDGMVDRGARLLGRRWRWLPPLAGRVNRAFAGRTRPRQIVLAKFLLADDGFVRAREKHDIQLSERIAVPLTKTPEQAARSWLVPAIRSPGELADWLVVSLS